MRQKSPSELNTKTVRVNIGDWHLLMELARQHDTTVAKVLHLAITKQAASEVAVTPRAQIPMAIGTTAYRALGTTAYRIAPVTTIATNGSKSAAFRIKTGRVKYE